MYHDYRDINLHTESKDFFFFQVIQNMRNSLSQEVSFTQNPLEKKGTNILEACNKHTQLP